MKTMKVRKEVLESIYGNSIESVEEVFKTFLNTHADITKDLLSVYNNGHLDKLKRILHYHGPSFMYLGLPEITDSFKKLEHLCTNVTSHHNVSDSFSSLIQMVEQSRLLVQNELSAIEMSA
jgi:hypothetical protein